MGNGAILYCGHAAAAYFDRTWDDSEDFAQVFGAGYAGRRSGSMGGAARLATCPPCKKRGRISPARHCLLW
jgi:hypothetical protein